MTTIKQTKPKLKLFLFLLLFISALTFTLVSCSNPTSVPPKPTPLASIKLNVVKTSLTEATIELTTSNITLPINTIINRDDKLLLSFNLTKKDTTIIDKNLEPNTNYTYKAIVEINGKQLTSANVTAHTTDTTSQNFTFETFEFGDGYETSFFNDVWIFDENNIWAVGFLNARDTVVDGEKIYNTNIIKWNGSKWKLLPYSGTSSGIYGIWAQDSSTIFFADGLVFKYKDGRFIEYDFTHLTFSNNQSVEKLWGSSENNVYGVGRNGIIVHYDGSPSGAGWTKIDFDNKWQFSGITGNPKTGIAYAVALWFNTVLVVKIENGSTEIIYNSDLAFDYRSEDIFYLNDKLYLASSDIWTIDLQTKKIERQFHLSSSWMNAIAASGENDIYFFGNELSLAGGGKMVHFNGKRYKILPLSFRSDIDGGAYAVNNIAAYCGFVNNKAFITIIRR